MGNIHYSRYLMFEGISVAEQGKQYYLDAHIAYRQAVLNAIAYLKQFGFSGEQAYLLLSSAPVEGRINDIVDIPNAYCTLALPIDIFEIIYSTHLKVCNHHRQVTKKLK